eukprot:13976977-Ditylum_brightwellii.AAC.1
MAVEQFKALPKANAPTVDKKLMGQNVLFASELISGVVVLDCVHGYHLLGFTLEKEEGGVYGVKGHGRGGRGDLFPKLKKNVYPTFFGIDGQEVIDMPVKNL